MSVWRFSIQGNTVLAGDDQRQTVTAEGCNEPFKDRFWCPKMQWFRKEVCPFVSREECENFRGMCGGL